MKDIERDYVIAFFSGIYAGLVVLAAQKFVLEPSNLQNVLIGSVLFLLFISLFFFMGLAAVKIGVDYLEKKREKKSK